MKGYEMILVVNGIIFLGVGAFAFGAGWNLRGQGESCPTGNVTACDRDLTVGDGTLRVAPYLFAAGVILLGLGVSLVLRRRWYAPARPPANDEGPGYP